MSEQTRANGNKCWAVTGPKWSIFNSAHRQIHLHKESPITYNPSAERTSDLTSTFYAVSRPAIALWTWQIAYWSADVVANVLSARAAAATCPKLHGSPAESSASPIPTFQSLLAGTRPPAPPCLPATLLIPPRSFLVLQGVEGVTDKRHLLQQAENGRWGRLRAMWPDAGRARPTKKNKVRGRFTGGGANTSSAQWQFMRGRGKKKI